MNIMDYIPHLSCYSKFIEFTLVTLKLIQYMVWQIKIYFKQGRMIPYVVVFL